MCFTRIYCAPTCPIYSGGLKRGRRAIIFSNCSAINDVRERWASPSSLGSHHRSRCTVPCSSTGQCQQRLANRLAGAGYHGSDIRNFQPGAAPVTMRTAPKLTITATTVCHQRSVSVLNTRAPSTSAHSGAVAMSDAVTDTGPAINES